MMFTYYLIHCDEHHERLAHIDLLKKRRGIEIEIFKGVHVTDLKYPHGLALKNHTFIKAGAIGCYLSHQRLLEHIRDTCQTEYAVIFEDDVWFPEDLEERIGRVVQSTPSTFDLVYLGNFLENRATHVKDNIFTIDFRMDCWGTHAILIQTSHAAKIVEVNKVVRHNIDTHYKMVIQEGALEGYVVYPSICKQAALPSNIDVGINGSSVSHISLRDRLEYYIGDCDHAAPVPVDGKTGYDKPVFITQDTYRQSMHPNSAYPLDVVRLLRHSQSKRLWINCGDSTFTDTKFPVMIKVRREGTHGVITNLESPRHWGEIGRHRDIPWDEKTPEVFWRGADTSYGVRLDFVKRFFKVFDVGFSQYVQDALKDPELYPRTYVKGGCPIETFMKYKYLPVVDGNDKSSSLNWVRCPVSKKTNSQH